MYRAHHKGHRGIRLSVILILLGFSSFTAVKAQDNDKVAHDLFEIGMETYNFSSVRDARELFIQATEFKPDLAQAQFMAGRCILETVNKGESLPYFLKAYELNQTIHDDILYFIAQAYHFQMEFEKAIEFYTRYREKVEKRKVWDRAQLLAGIDRNIQECRNATIYVANAADVKISNLGSGINSEYPEYGPVVSADESILIYTARRDDNVSYNKANDNLFFEDIYVARNQNGQWTGADNIGSPVNTDYHDAAMGLSPDGNTLFMYKDEGSGDIFLCERLDDGTWSKPRTMGPSVNSSYKESSVSVSGDGSYLYFSSSRPGGFGGMDVYRCQSDRKGRWIRAENLGSAINTSADEDGVFISKDGQTLYFSSRGHTGMGGFDIYQSTYDSVSGTWGEPVNLGYPINSVDDDIYFALSGNGKRGYYSSVKSFGKGEKDLYVVDMTNFDPQPLTVLEKRYKEMEAIRRDEVANAADAQPITLKVYSVSFGDKDTLSDVQVQVHRVGSEEMLKGVLAKDQSVHFDIKEPEAAHYRVTVWKKGYINFEDDVTIPAAGSEAHAIDEVATLQKIGIGARGVMEIQFDSQDIKPANYEEVDHLFRLMKDNPEIRVRILGHTDNQGDAEFNRKLSENRAKHIRDYLISKGIAVERLEYIGYGYDKPVASNDSEEGRQRNRRTEFEIIQ